MCIDFLNFIGFSECNKCKSFLHKSLSIIISRVTNKLSDEIIINKIKILLIKIIDDELTSNKINFEEHSVFKNVIENNQIGIFSNPEKETLLEDIQKYRILDIVYRMLYIKNNNFKIKISNDYVQELYRYNSKHYKKLMYNINETLFSNFFSSDIAKHTIDQASDKYKRFHELKIIIHNNTNNFESLLKNFKILDRNTSEIFLSKISYLSFLNNFISKENNLTNLLEGKNILDSLERTIDYMMKNLVYFIQQEFKKFHLRFNLILNGSFKIFLNISLDSLEQATEIYKKIKMIKSADTKKNDFVKFLNILMEIII